MASSDTLVMPSDGVWNHPLLALVRPELVLSRLVSGDRRPLHCSSQKCHSILLEDAEMLRNVNQPEDRVRSGPNKSCLGFQDTIHARCV